MSDKKIVNASIDCSIRGAERELYKHQELFPLASRNRPLKLKRHRNQRVTNQPHWGLTHCVFE